MKTTSFDTERPPLVLVIIGSLYNFPSKAGLDVAKILSYFFRRAKVISYPAFTFDSIVRALWRWLRREILVAAEILRGRSRIKLIVLHQVVAVFCCFLGKMARAKVMVYVGGSIYECSHQKGVAKVAALLSFILWCVQLKLANRILVPSQHLVNLRGLSSCKHKIRVAPTRFIKIQDFKETNFNKRGNVIGYVGRFEAEKGIGILPEIINLTVKSKRVSNLEWILVGNGSLRKRIEDEVRELGLCGVVKITGWVNDPETYLTKMRLLLLPSKSEGLPNVVLEAMACGTPVLATPVGAIPDIIKEGETGFLLKSNDPKHIAERIVELLNNPELLEKVSIKAYNYVRENFSFEKTLDAWRKILSEL
jgi:glycosyltransferase involved in cell wall biosynthesis